MVVFPRSSLLSLAAILAAGALTACGTGAGTSSSGGGGTGSALAIVDVNGDRKFDRVDLQLFADAYHLDASSAPPPTTQYDSRYDLNGDGEIGGSSIGRFDLDQTGSDQVGVPRYGVVVQTIEGLEIHLNENTLSDVQILCYYAYSPLYEGDVVDRGKILGTKHCANLSVDATLGGLHEGSADLAVVVKDGTGAPVSGVFVRLVATGGTLGSPSGTTDEKGTVIAPVTLASGSLGIIVLVTTHAGPSGDVLGQGRAEARVGSGVAGCQVSGDPLDFHVSDVESTLFWSADPSIDPADPSADQSQINLLWHIPSDQLPFGVFAASVRIEPIRRELLPQGEYFGSAFAISAIDPAGFEFFPNGTTPFRLAVRYDPAKCWMPPAVEETVVLGRYDTASETWNDVCGDPADPTAAVREVSCANADLGFGIFGVIKKVGNDVTDRTPPTFPSSSGFLLISPGRCDMCAPPSIDLEWGPASDTGGSGIKGYWIYVDGIKAAFSSDTLASPTVRYTLQSSAPVDTTSPHLYQVQAEDNAGNESALFGSLRSP